MLRKIILPLVLLIFTQQELYGMEEIKVGEEAQVSIWQSINNCINKDISRKDGKSYPKLWWLWAFFDNVPFQYGGSKIWKHGEAYYGLSNGIGFFFSFLNFGWLKVGIGDVHINVINLILDYFKNFIYLKSEKKFEILPSLLLTICVNLFSNIHIFSVKILNCIKIKLVAPLFLGFNGYVGTKEDSTAWYITYNEDDQISFWYGLLSPRIELNIPGIIDYFKGQ